VRSDILQVVITESDFRTARTCPPFFNTICGGKDSAIEILVDVINRHFTWKNV